MNGPFFRPAFVLCALLVAKGPAEAASVDVRSTGAKADRITNDAPAIQAAIDACSRDGGGEVLVPAGQYLTGELHLKSHVTLNLQAGAVLWASAQAADYDQGGKPNRSDLITAHDQVDVALVGNGTIEGTGQGELDRRSDPEREANRPTHRYGILSLQRCQRVRVRDLLIHNSEAHTIILTRCQDVEFDHVSIIDNFWRTNTDGIDPVSCKNVFISNCRIVAGDDCICPKTENGEALENLVVSNCILESVAGAIKLGTGSSGDFRHIRVSNCVIRNSGVGVGIFMKDGGTVEDASFDHLSIETTRQSTEINHRLRNNIIPIYIDIEKRTPSGRAGFVRDVSFSNITIDSDNGILIQGMPERRIENLSLRNITFRVTEGFDFSARTKREGGTGNSQDDRITRFIRQPTYLALAYIDGLEVDHLRVFVGEEIARKFDRSALSVFESANVVLRDVRREPAAKAGGVPAVVLSNVQQNLDSR